MKPLLNAAEEKFDTYLGREAPSPYPSPASGRGKLRASRATGEGVKFFVNGCTLLAALLLSSSVTSAALADNAKPQAAATGAVIGGAFTLTDQNGKKVSDADLRGKYMLLFFGFTHCPDLCPTTLLVMSQAMDKLGGDAAKVAPVFVTVDPQRDTPPVLKKFLGNFSPAIIGLTGSQKQIDALEEKYKTYSLKVDDKDAPDGHTFDHSGYIYLMDPQGKFLMVFTSDSSPETIAGKIRGYMGEQGSK